MPVRPFTQADLRWLVCPVCHQPLRLDADQLVIECAGCARRYPVVDGLPVLLSPL